MDKSNIYEKFTGYVEQLRNTECSQKEKISCFHHIAECIMSPALVSNINYATHCGTATNVLLLFCEDLDSVVRMSAEENLNKIFRMLEKTRVSRILMDLYGEIKRNGNQRSLRICLNLFSYYAPQIKEKHVKWYAVRLLQCLSIISQRKETLVQETLCEFVKSFSKYIQQGLTDSETCKLFEIFLGNISAECAVKRRCSSQNCISLIENARNKSLMAKHGLNKVIELMLRDQQTNTVLGALGFLRLLLPLIIRGFNDDYNDDGESVVSQSHSYAQKQVTEQQQKTAANKINAATTTINIRTTTITNECRQIIEIYDYCLHLLSTNSTTNHSIINAALEVINAVLQALDASANSNSSNSNAAAAAMAKSLRELLCNQQLQHNEYLRRRKSLKNQIFQLKNYEEAAAAAAVKEMTISQHQQRQQHEQQQQQQQQEQQKEKQIKEGNANNLSTYNDNYAEAEVEVDAGKSELTAASDVRVDVDVGIGVGAGAGIGQVAYQFGMQKISNAKTLQKECQQQQGQEQQLESWQAVRINASASASASTTDEDAKDRQKIIRQHIRNSARSISECVVNDDSDDADFGGTTTHVDAIANADVVDDDDEDDFTTLSEINEAQQTPSVAGVTTAELTLLATKIDVDNLIDAIDAKSTDIRTATQSAKIAIQPEITQAAAVTATAENVLLPFKPQLQQSLQNLLNSSAVTDDKSQFLSDIDNESFNSIEFDAEITIGGTINATESGATNSPAADAPNKAATTTAATTTEGNTENGKSSSDTIGSFFNNLISHSNAASESVSKLFRQSSAAKSTPTKSTASLVNEKSDTMSGASLSVGDTLSLSSLASSELPERQPSIAETPVEDSYSATASYTASTAILVDTNTKNTTADSSTTDELPDLFRKPNVNPFLSEKSPLKQTVVGLPLITVKIGSATEQPLIYYSARLIAARFLLTGQAGCLQADSVTRVSIKSLSLNVLAQCVRLAPQILQLRLEISAEELQLLQPVTSKSSSASGSPSQAPSNSSTEMHLDADNMNTKDSTKKSLFSPMSGNDSANLIDETMLLEIKDDHFGKSTCEYLLNQPALTRSADTVLLQQQLKPTNINSRNPTGIDAAKNVANETLSKSEIIATPISRQTSYRVTVAAEDAPPTMLPPKPPKRTKSMRKSIASATATIVKLQESIPETYTPASAPTEQAISDVLLFYKHTDPILRGGVQQIIGNFIQATGAGLFMPLRLNLQHLLAILLKGFEDEIHTVVIQSLNAFDKIFSHVVSKYLTGPPCHYHAHHHQQQKVQQKQHKNEKVYAETEIVAETEQQQNFGKQTSMTAFTVQQLSSQDNASRIEQQQQQWQCQKKQTYTKDGMHAYDDSRLTLNSTSSWSATHTRTTFTDNDELIAALLYDFQLQSNRKHNNETSRGDAYVSVPATATCPAVATSSVPTAAEAVVSPKLLLSKLRLCHHNKYWLVQNKYAEIISNLNYELLRSYYGNAGCDFDDNNNNNNDSKNTEKDNNINKITGAKHAGILAPAQDDIVCTYETQFLEELLHLLGDDDFRVREHAAACLCRFVIQTSKQQQQQQQQQQQSSETSSAATTLYEQQLNAYCTNSSCGPETQQTNFNLLWDFFDYRIFGGMSVTLRNLFRANSSIPLPLAETSSYLSTTTSSLSSSSSATGTTASASISAGLSYQAGGASAAASALGDGELAAGDVCGNVFAFQRQIVHEEKVLVKVLYRLTNKLMVLNDKNLQFGIIFALRLLLRHFNFVDYQRAWTEYNFIEICMKYSYHNNATAVDLNCQNDLIDVMGKLISGEMLCTMNVQKLQPQVDYLLAHTMKLLNIYYHLFTNLKPMQQSGKTQKTEIFSTLNARELTLTQALGYFGGDYVYMKLYSILRGANDSYKITINHESGNLLISLLKTCLNTLSLCIELRMHPLSGATTPVSAAAAAAAGSVESTVTFPSNSVLKLIEEILHYLTKLINYAPGECVACLRQLLKYLFAQNYGNRQQDYYQTFIRPYFAARQWISNSGGADNTSTRCNVVQGKTMLQTINPNLTKTAMLTPTMTHSTQTPTETPTPTPKLTMTMRMSSTPTQQNLIEMHENYGGQSGVSTSTQNNILYGELFAFGLNFHAWKSPNEGDCAKHIKLFEPLVIYCLTLFMKSNAKIQAPILELLSQLLDLNVTYSILDSKNVIFDQILNNLDLIESGIARNAHIIIPPMMKFLVQLTHKSDRKLITIPKIISITNNLLANGTVRDVALLALKSLSYELFFMIHSDHEALAVAAEKRAPFQSPITGSPVQQRRIGAVSAEDAISTAAAAAETLLAHKRELDTQKEVVLGMLEKFIDAYACQQVLGLLLLYERSAQQMHLERTLDAPEIDTTAVTNVTMPKCESTQDADAIYALICRAICTGQISVNNLYGYFLLECYFKNNGKNVLADSKEFLKLLQLLIEKDVSNFSDLSYATIILANVILKTEEIYLVNHIKLYLKNNPTAECQLQQQQQQQQQHYQWQLSSGGATSLHWLHEGPSTSSAAAAAARLSSSSPTAGVAAAAAAVSAVSGRSAISEINYFAKVLCEKLVSCFTELLVGVDGNADSTDCRISTWTSYCGLVTRFVNALHSVCCRSRHKASLQSVFRLVLTESEFLCKYYNLLLMSGDAAIAAQTLHRNGASYEASMALDHLLLAVFRLLLAMRLLDPLVLLAQAAQSGLKWNVQRALLREVCRSNQNLKDWNQQQVTQLFDGKYLNFLIADHFRFLCNLFEVNEAYGSLFQASLLRHIGRLNKHSIRSLLRLLLRLCTKCSTSDTTIGTLQCLSKLHHLNSEQRALQLQIERLAQRLVAQIPSAQSTAIHEFLKQHIQETVTSTTTLTASSLPSKQLELCKQLAVTIFNDFPVDSSNAGSVLQPPRIIDESWLFAQLIKFSTQSDENACCPRHLTRILVDIQSEHKLHKIFNDMGELRVARLLRHAIGNALESMLTVFRQNCIQHNPHIHYMQPNPLARVACAVLMARIGVAVAAPRSVCGMEQLHLAQAVTALLQSVRQIEVTALIYVDAKFIDKFLRDNLLRQEHIAVLLSFLRCCCDWTKELLLVAGENSVPELLQCIDELLRQRYIWQELNQTEKQSGCISHAERCLLLCQLLDLLGLTAQHYLQDTIFYHRNKMPMPKSENYIGSTEDTAVVSKLLHAGAPRAIFIAKLIETQIDIEAQRAGMILATVSKQNGAQFAPQELANVQDLLSLITSIGISLLRTNLFYAYAVTPHEIIQQQEREQQALTGGTYADASPSKRSTCSAASTAAMAASSASGKLPTIPVECLSDVDVLRKFVKRLSIFGYTTRQQFEEYFMTFLLLINKVYDENMVDQQEQFQIKSVCMQAIMELLITYKTFPIVGSGNRILTTSYFHHTPRWTRITCDSISLKKLHKVQLLISDANVFYHPNLERNLFTENIIGTHSFQTNQFDLNFIWQQMETFAQPAAVGGISGSEGTTADAASGTGAALSMSSEDIALRNYCHFTHQSGIDFRSSSQLVFEVLMQMIELNHILVLPNLLQFCEICESRDQIKWIKERATKLQETLPMDDTISHQHLIYLLCKTQALLIPTIGEMQQLCNLIGNYLKSSHVFIRNATLKGLLCLLESCSKTNTTIGKLSDELIMLRDLTLSYINRHGIIDDGPLQFSEEHTKLVWTLNYSLIEWTSKYVTQCHLLSNTIIAAGKILRSTNNVDIYLCILHGLERIVINSGIGVGNAASHIGKSINNSGNGGVGGCGTGNGIVTPLLRNKIEKLALELLKKENEKFSIPALKLLLSCIYVGSSKQLETTELSNGIVQDDPEIIAQQTDKVDILLHCIKSSSRDAAWIYGHVLCQIIRDLVPPNEILTKVIKEFLAINQPHCDVIAMIVYQVFRSAIDSSFLEMLQDWLICSLPTFLSQTVQKGVWGLSVIFLSASINLHLIKLFPVVLDAGRGTGIAAGKDSSNVGIDTGDGVGVGVGVGVEDAMRESRKLGQHEIALFVTAAQDFHAKLSAEQKIRFRDAFKNFQQHQVYAKMLQSL